MANDEKRHEFAQRLNILLKENNITQSELAKKLNIAKSSVNGWCKGSAFPRMNKIIELAFIFHVDPAFLITGEEIQEDSYYLDPETAKKAQEIFENKELSLLFDAARDASPEDIQTVHTMLLALKKKEKGE